MAYVHHYKKINVISRVHRRRNDIYYDCSARKVLHKRHYVYKSLKNHVFYFVVKVRRSSSNPRRIIITAAVFDSNNNRLHTSVKRTIFFSTETVNLIPQPPVRVNN